MCWKKLFSVSGRLQLWPDRDLRARSCTECIEDSFGSFSIRYFFAKIRAFSRCKDKKKQNYLILNEMPLSPVFMALEKILFWSTQQFQKIIGTNLLDDHPVVT